MATAVNTGGSGMVPSSSTASETPTDDNDEKTLNDGNQNQDLNNETKESKDGRRVSRQQSAPTTNTRVSFNKKKNSINNDNNNNNNNNNDNTSTNQTNNSNNSNNINNNGKNGTKLVSNSNSLDNSDNDNEGEDDSKSPDALLRAKSVPANTRYDPCREFDNFAGDWVDSKGQPVLISAWGVIRYPNNPKLRFEAVHMGPNHLSVTFDRDPKRRKFVGKLNHNCNVLIWSNDTRWSRKGTKPESPGPEAQSNGQQYGNQNNNNNNNNNASNTNENQGNEDPKKLHRQGSGSCIVM